jgi:predicted transcriptional regulator
MTARANSTGRFGSLFARLRKPASGGPPPLSLAREAHLAALNNGSLESCGQVVAPASAGYTFGMKTAISLPDGIFREAERLAKRLKKSRSELYQEAVAEYVARHEPEAITEAMNDVAAQLDTGLDTFSSNAARHVLERSEW